VVRQLEILDSAHAGITLHGPRSINDLTFENVLLQGPNERGLHIMPGATAINVKADGLRVVRTAATPSAAP
jgi:hypothetical protein